MTTIQGINGVTSNLLLNNVNEERSRLTGSDSFTYALEAAKNLIASNKEAEQVTAQKTIDFMTGENDNIVDLLVAQEKSNILLQYSLQVRSGVLSAYKEIMNLSI